MKDQPEPDLDGLSGVRLGAPADLPSVLTMVAACAEAPPWPPKLWQDLLCAKRDGEVERLVLLAQTPSRALCGVLVAQRLVEETELELVLVPAACRRRGLGHALVARWMVWASNGDVRSAHLEVRESNLGARQLYRRFGFTVVGRRRAYYRDPTEDALLMRRELP